MNKWGDKEQEKEEKSGANKENEMTKRLSLCECI